MELLVSPATQALVYRFLLGLTLAEIPIATAVLSSPSPDYRLLGLGLLGGLATALEKYVAPYVSGGLGSNLSAANALASAAPPGQAQVQPTPQPSPQPPPLPPA